MSTTYTFTSPLRSVEATSGGTESFGYSWNLNVVTTESAVQPGIGSPTFYAQLAPQTLSQMSDLAIDALAQSAELTLEYQLTESDSGTTVFEITGMSFKGQHVSA